MFDDEFKGFEFSDETECGHALRPYTTNHIAPVIIAAGIAAGGSIISGMMSKKDSGSNYPDPKILPKTVSGNDMTDFDILFNQEAETAMREMAQSLETMASQDRDFFKNTFQPYQESIINTNTKMLPMIEQVASAALEANTRDMITNESLKNSFAATAEGGFEKGGRVDTMANKFFSELEKMPSEQDMIGSALSQVEGQFQGAGKELARDFAQRGQSVSQSSARDLAFQKATAKAGAASTASQQFRQESLSRAQAGLGAATDLEAAEMQLKGQATEGLLALQQRQDEAGLFAKQMQLDVGEVQTGEGMFGMAGGLRESDALKQLGTDTTTESIAWTQKGIKGAVTQNPDGSVNVGGNQMSSGEYQQLLNKIKQLSSQRSRNNRSGDRNDGNPGETMGGGFGGGGEGSGSNGDGSTGGMGDGAAGSGAPGAGACCFVAGTQISTDNGVMSIEDATAGDIVKSYNMLTTDLGESIVGEFFEVQREGYYELTFDNGKVLKITDDHPVYTQYGWAAINPMRAKANPGYSTLGDVTLLSEGSCVLTESKQLVTLVHVLYVEGDITTYTLGKVSPNANFFAEGFLVSNRIC